MSDARHGFLDCGELVELVTDYLEDALPAPLRVRFEQHLSVCPGCRAYLGQLRETLRAAGRLSEESLTGQAREALLEAFRGWKRRNRPA